ncbi:MAG TPA: alpha/beta fold hydrolase [Thermoanaerobaculia bacterium]|nr:alpha/beta fold hydrolase [Thermoanaerobaculia bacterium]
MDLHRVEVPPHTFRVGQQGSGPPVVLIHGLGGSADWWERNVDAFAARYTVYAVEVNKLPLRFEEIASLLARWIDSSIGQPVHLVGNSMGGHIAVHLATLRPDLVRSLVLVSSTGVPFRLAPAEHIRNLFFPRGLFGFFLMLMRDAFRTGPAAITLSLGRILIADARPLLRALSMPVLLVWGERDPLVPLGYAKAMLQLIPNARLEVVPHASHVAMWENPQFFNRTVLAFFSNVSDEQRGDAPAIFSWPISGWNDGIADRRAGRGNDVVLIHGLGMSSEYFVHFARALFDRGRSPIAPDLRGFGESADAPGLTPRAHAEDLARWADAIGIRNAMWIGHSLGCNVVAHVAGLRPDLVRESVCIGPLWRSRFLIAKLPLDAVREPPRLFTYVLRAYWRCGLGRWFSTLRRSLPDIRKAPPPNTLMLCGRGDPLPDRDAIANLIEVPGAHACHFSFPEDLAHHIGV